jgi:hypothetical protein
MFETLTRVNWDVFGHLTFKSLKARSLLYAYVFRLMREASDISARPYRELLIAVRYERGEIGDRPHFHVLVGGTQTLNQQTLAHQLIAKWKAMTGGRVQFRPYIPCGSAEDYLMKECGWTYAGANGYEVAKFDRADDVTLSRSVSRCLRATNCIEVRRHSAAHKLEIPTAPFVT